MPEAVPSKRNNRLPGEPETDPPPRRESLLVETATAR
jgi:hypothetical protein